MNAVARLEALAAGPKPWLVTTIYADGRTRTLRQPREAMARNFAEREASKIGRKLICRETLAEVEVVRVTVEHSPE